MEMVEAKPASTLDKIEGNEMEKKGIYKASVEVITVITNLMKF